MEPILLVIAQEPSLSNLVPLLPIHPVIVVGRLLFDTVLRALMPLGFTVGPERLPAGVAPDEGIVISEYMGSGKLAVAHSWWNAGDSGWPLT